MLIPGQLLVIPVKKEFYGNSRAFTVIRVQNHLFDKLIN